MQHDLICGVKMSYIIGDIIDKSDAKHK